MRVRHKANSRENIQITRAFWVENDTKVSRKIYIVILFAAHARKKLQTAEDNALYCTAYLANSLIIDIVVLLLAITHQTHHQSHCN